MAADDSSTTSTEFIFLGTGTSSSLPHLDCLTAPPGKKPCRTCLSTLTPEGKKNIRRNTSAVMRIKGKDEQMATIVIDTGKTFQAAAIEWFPKYGLRKIDAVLITHAHADAMNGLDDLRGWTLSGAIQPHVDLYVSQTTYTEVQRSFPYLVSKEFASGGGDVPDFKWHIIEDHVPFEVGNTGIMITPFLVQHGRMFSTAPPPGCMPTPHIPPPEMVIPDITYPNGDILAERADAALSLNSNPKNTNGISNGLSTNGTSAPATNGHAHTNGHTNGQSNGLLSATTASAPSISVETTIQPYLCFGFKIKNDILYISDVSHIPANAWPIITPSSPNAQTPVLVLDCLHLRTHTSHFGLEQAVETARRIGAQRTFLLGFGHEVAHEEWATILRAVHDPCAARKGMEGLSKVERRGVEMVPPGQPVWVRAACDGLRLEVREDREVVVHDDEYNA